MYIKNRALALFWRCACLFACGYALVTMSNLFHGGFTNRMLAYYTNLSSMIVFAYLLLSITHTVLGIWRHGLYGASTLMPSLKRAFVMMVTITVIVYHFALAPMAFRMNLSYHAFSLPDILIHYVTPLGFILDWMLFDEKKQIRRRDPLLWLILPAAYLIFVFIRAEVAEPLNAAGVRFPYFFLDLDILPAHHVLGYVILCLGVFTFVGYLYFFIDRISISLGRDKHIDV